jgi:hypothetical protein
MRLKNVAIAAGALMLVAAAMAPVAMRATAASSKSSGAPNFSGFWVIDRKASDKPPQGMGRGGGGGGGEHKGGHGQWGGPPPGGGPDGGPPPDGERRGGGRGRMLPPKMRITSSEQGLAVADSSGTIVQDIRFGTVDKDGAKKEPPQFGSSWKGDKLVVTHEGPRGAVTEVFDLDVGGKRLVIETTMQGRDGEKRTMKRVYTKG